jgi:ABC-type uncharacterized transport system permease subunit
MTLESATRDDDWPRDGVYYTLVLSNKVHTRSRIVSNVVTLIAEVSGFADIFMIFGTILVGVVNRVMMDSTVAKSLGPLQFTQ